LHYFNRRITRIFTKYKSFVFNGLIKIPNQLNMFNKLVAAALPLMPKKLIWLFSKKYIAGETIEDAIRVSKELNRSGAMVTIDLLGEFITKLEEAEENRKNYIEIIERIEQENINGNYSLKPTMFGLMIDKEVCYQNIREVVKTAVKYNNFVRIDMEDSRCVDMEIDMFKRLKAEFPKNVGLVFQAYLKRTYDDLQNLSSLNSAETPVSYRLCKGIYVESPEIAYKKYEEVNEKYLNDLEYLLQNKMYVGIATHDKPLVEAAYKLLEKHNVPKDMYEFQMLYGVTPDRRKEVISKGHRMRIYVPFGKHWFGYSTRRLKENPHIATHIIKALFIHS